jgi:hypothetical protein
VILISEQSHRLVVCIPALGTRLGGLLLMLLGWGVGGLHEAKLHLG